MKTQVNYGTSPNELTGLSLTLSSTPTGEPAAWVQADVGTYWT